MIVILKNGYAVTELKNLTDRLLDSGVKAELVKSVNGDFLLLSGEVYKLDHEALKAVKIVESVKKTTEPYYLASRKSRFEDTVISVSGKKIGGKNFTFIAGPCAAESRAQMIKIATALKDCGVDFLRGGAFKPRTSPYTFQGTGEKGLEYLLQAKAETGLPVISEITDVRQIDLFKDIDILQVGARNMQNFALLKEVAKMGKPVLIKRGFANTVEELLLSAEYVMAEGESRVILCERGIRTFEPSVRSTFDLSSVAALKKLTHLPVITDPSHASGAAELVRPLALASAAVGADGLMIEVHNSPETALCDGAQSVTPEEFSKIYKDAIAVAAVCGKSRG